MNEVFDAIMGWNTNDEEGNMRNGFVSLSEENQFFYENEEMKIKICICSTSNITDAGAKLKEILDTVDEYIYCIEDNCIQATEACRKILY